MSRNECERCHEYAEDGMVVDEYGFYICGHCEKCQVCGCPKPEDENCRECSGDARLLK